MISKNSNDRKLTPKSYRKLDPKVECNAKHHGRKLASKGLEF